MPIGGVLGWPSEIFPLPESMMTTEKNVQKDISGTLRDENDWKLFMTLERCGRKMADARGTYSRRVGEGDDDRKIL